ncbi:MAG TPA: cytosine permease, partial [Steroidobacteraceae bacterium]
MGNGTFIETRSIDYVPLAERHGKVWHLWPVWFSGDAHLATLAVGVVGITLGGNLLWTAIAVILGCLLGTFFMAFHSTQGPQLGLPQMIQSRPQFGYAGALLVWGVALVAYVGYNAFNQVLAAQALHQLIPAISATSGTAMVLFALLALALAVVGYDKIHLAQRGFAYLMIVILTVFSVAALFVLRLPATQWQLTGFRAVPFLAQLFAAAMQHAADAVVPVLGRILLGTALLGLVTISSLNYYGASLTLLSVADTVKPLKCTAGKRIASLVVAFAASCVIAVSSS